MIFVLILAFIKFYYKISLLRVIYLNLVPLLFAALFNIYIRLVLNETLLSLFKIEQESLKNTLKTIFSNILCYLMQKLIKL
jgi:hypothetical protein